MRAALPPRGKHALLPGEAWPRPSQLGPGDPLRGARQGQARLQRGASSVTATCPAALLPHGLVGSPTQREGKGTVTASISPGPEPTWGEGGRNNTPAPIGGGGGTPKLVGGGAPELRGAGEGRCRPGAGGRGKEPRAGATVPPAGRGAAGDRGPPCRPHSLARSLGGPEQAWRRGSVRRRPQHRSCRRRRSFLDTSGAGWVGRGSPDMQMRGGARGHAHSTRLGLTDEPLPPRPANPRAALPAHE